MGEKPKTTDMLLDAVHAAAKTEQTDDLLGDIPLRRHSGISARQCGGSPEIDRDCLNDWSDIRDILKAIKLMQLAHETVLELVSGYGDAFSAQVMSAAMREMGLPFEFLNARDVLRVRHDDVAGQTVEWDLSEELLNDVMAQCQKVLGYKPHFVITGFVASTTEEIATTFKRDGSDCSAFIFGRSSLPML